MTTTLTARAGHTTALPCENRDGRAVRDFTGSSWIVNLDDDTWP